MKKLVLLALACCANDPKPATQTPVSSAVASVAAASVSVPSPMIDAEAIAQNDLDASVDVFTPKPPPKRVLHCGDSMVGGFGGLTKALETRFKEMGAKFKSDSQTSVSIQTYARDKHFSDLLKETDPDLVIITLGANDMAAPFPSSLAPFIQSIVKKVGSRECWWLPPIPWSKDTKLIPVIKDNAAPCKVFDASSLKVARWPDGIHPTDKGGQEWANAFFETYATSR